MPPVTPLLDQVHSPADTRAFSIELVSIDLGSSEGSRR